MLGTATCRMWATAAPPRLAPEFIRLCPRSRLRKLSLSVICHPSSACRFASRRNFDGTPDINITVIVSSFPPPRITAPIPDSRHWPSRSDPIEVSGNRRLTHSSGLRRQFGQHHRATGSLAGGCRDGASDAQEVRQQSAFAVLRRRVHFHQL